MIVILAVVLLVGAAGVAIWRFMAPADHDTDPFVLLSVGFTDRKIVDEDSALAAIGDAADILGISDVGKEFSACKEDAAFGNTYYRFYQEYEGIPVYGRSVVVAADESGDSLLLSGNYLSTSGLDISPKIDEEAALASARQYYGEDAEIISEGLAVYSLHDHRPELTLKLCVNFDHSTEYCFISAASSDVVAQTALAYTETVLGTGVDIDGEERTFHTNTNGRKFVLEDVGRNIYIYNANHGTLVWKRAMMDDNNNIYF